MIKKTADGQWLLLFSDGRKEGPFPSYERAKARDVQVRQIQGMVKSGKMRVIKNKNCVSCKKKGK